MTGSSAWPEVLLMDIEGTTTSLSFVKDTLFPYSRERLPAFVRDHADEATVRAALSELKAHANKPEMTDDEAAETALRYIDEDRKLAPLKVLQGLIWEDGYKQGAYTAHLYPDVVDKLKEAKGSGTRLYVYSSGSVFAQKLLFGHTDAGDITPLFEGYFDTATGPKKEAHSYQVIADAVGAKPERILFLSDSLAELDAAAAAAVNTIGLDRDGFCEALDTAKRHRWIASFSALPSIA